jgi:hypothetical protein
MCLYVNKFMQKYGFILILPTGGILNYGEATAWRSVHATSNQKHVSDMLQAERLLLTRRSQKLRRARGNKNSPCREKRPTLGGEFSAQGESILKISPPKQHYFTLLSVYNSVYETSIENYRFRHKRPDNRPAGA